MAAQVPRIPGRSSARAALVAVAAAALYGSWAAAANWSAGLHHAARASLVQALLSFVSTLCIVMILEWLFGLGRTLLRGFLLAAVGTPALVCAATLSAHAAARTPNILATSLPPILIGSVFGAFYAYRLYLVARRSERGA
ncbi:hypothetical protein [Sorangium sp. So ce854]|uniref:hypothetical protein n=1 Tax=Sorangium sp. So ce854 TaxID=3133322 RepID=UPI003F5EA50E